MNYELTIYGPLVDNQAERANVEGRLLYVFPGADYRQCVTVWETMRNYPDFNSVTVIKRSSGDLVVHVYYSPVGVPEDVDCAFHAKISPEGTYA